MISWQVTSTRAWHIFITAQMPSPDTDPGAILGSIARQHACDGASGSCISLPWYELSPGHKLLLGLDGGGLTRTSWCCCRPKKALLNADARTCLDAYGINRRRPTSGAAPATISQKPMTNFLTYPTKKCPSGRHDRSRSRSRHCSVAFCCCHREQR